jgi:hypothetical protein
LLYARGSRRKYTRTCVTDSPESFVVVRRRTALGVRYWGWANNWLPPAALTPSSDLYRPSQQANPKWFLSIFGYFHAVVEVLCIVLQRCSIFCCQCIPTTVRNAGNCMGFLIYSNLVCLTSTIESLRWCMNAFVYPHPPPYHCMVVDEQSCMCLNPCFISVKINNSLFYGQAMTLHC